MRPQLEFARQAHGLEKLIQQTSPDLYENEVSKVKEVLVINQHLIYNCFDYYTATFSEIDTSGMNEPDVFNMSFNAYLAWAKACKLTSSNLHGRDLEMFWVQVNAVEESTKEADRHSRPRAFNRHKFIQARVRYICRYLSVPTVT